MTKVQFPQTLEAAMASEKSAWKIGEALLKETTESVTGKRGLQAAADELAAHGITYSTHYLGNLRSVAESFPRNRRHPLPITTHIAAGNPDVLDVIVKAAKKAGHRVTQPYVEAAINAMRAEERGKREQAKIAAERELKKAAADEEAAREKQKTAKDHNERERAERERDAAAQRKRQASDKIKKSITVRTGKKDRAAPREDDVIAMVANTGTMANASEARRLAERSQKMIAPHVADLSPRAIAGLTDAAMKAANAWKAVADTLRGASLEKRRHLSVVGE